MSAVDVKNLTFSFACSEPVLNDISMAVSAGEVLVIAGLSGSGKTTLCRILSGVIPHVIKGSVDGHINVAGIDPGAAGVSQTALRAGFVFQDADDQIVCSTVEDELAFGLENLCLPPDEIRMRVDGLAAEFGFGSLLHTNTAHLSGGQKKLLTIAAVLAPSPPVLILDEPMSSLDIDGRGLVRTAIERQRELGRAVIIVEHDLELVTFADKWLVLEEGRVFIHDTPADILSDRKDLLIKAGVWE